MTTETISLLIPRNNARYFSETYEDHERYDCRIAAYFSCLKDEAERVDDIYNYNELIYMIKVTDFDRETLNISWDYCYLYVVNGKFTAQSFLG